MVPASDVSLFVDEIHLNVEGNRQLAVGVVNANRELSSLNNRNTTRPPVPAPSNNSSSIGASSVEPTTGSAPSKKNADVSIHSVSILAYLFILLI